MVPQISVVAQIFDSCGYFAVLFKLNKPLLSMEPLKNILKVLLYAWVVKGASLAADWFPVLCLLDMWNFQQDTVT